MQIILYDKHYKTGGKMRCCPSHKNLDENKTIFTEEVASEGDLQRALRHYGNWLKLNKDKIYLIDRFIVAERGYKVVVIYQLKNEIPNPGPTY